MQAKQYALLSLVFAVLAIIILCMPMRTWTEPAIKLNTSSYRLWIGETAGLSYEITGTDRSPVIRSDAPLIASVTQDGTICAISPGVANIYITEDKLQAVISVEVIGVPVTEVAFTEEKLQIMLGDSLEIQPVFNADATDRRLQWYSDRTDIVSVNEKGLITGLAEGTAHITCRTSNGLYAGCDVQVRIATQQAIVQPESMKLSVKESKAIQVFFVPENATDFVKNWFTSDASVCTVDENGVVKAVFPGTAFVRGETDQGILLSVAVTVE